MWWQGRPETWVQEGLGRFLTLPMWRFSYLQTAKEHLSSCIFAEPFNLFLNMGLCACKVASVMSISLRPLWTVALQSPLFMGFSRQESWSGLPCCPPGDLSNPGIEPHLMSSALAAVFFSTSTPWDKKGLSQICKISLNYLKGASQPQAFSHTFLL